MVKLSHWPNPKDINVKEKTEECDDHEEYNESNWDNGSIDLATLADEDSRPSTPMLGKKVQGNMFYDDIEELMLGWTDGNQRNRH